MKINAWGKTDIGLKRGTNQDSILVDKSLGLFVVADGMGGHRGGEVASTMAVDTVYEMTQTENERPNGFSSVSSFLVRAYDEASARIYHTSSFEKPELEGMGTTLVLGLIQNNTIYIANVGDSRAYLYHEPSFLATYRGSFARI